jgi:uncharacterized phage protein (TIGR02220 family)
MEGLNYSKISSQDIKIAENFFENDKHLDEFLANVSRYYCGMPLTIKTKIVKKYFTAYMKTMDFVIQARTKGKIGGQKRSENQSITNHTLEGALENNSRVVDDTLQPNINSKVISNNIKEEKEKKTPTGDPSALQPQSLFLGASQSPAGDPNIDASAKFLAMFNKVTGRSFKAIDTKTLRQLKTLIASGYAMSDIEKAIKNALEDKFHKDEKYKYLTPEFITRLDKFQKFLFAEPAKTNEMKDQMDAFKFFEQAEIEAKRTKVE